MSGSSGITVVVPVHDGVTYLGEAIASLQAQTLPPAAIVVVDDGSTDGSGELARAAGVHVVRTGTRGTPAGIGAARNAGVREASTPLLAFLDADDLSRPGRFERQAAALAADPALDGVLCHIRIFLSPDKAQELEGRHHVPAEPMAGWQAGGMLIRRERFLAVGAWNEDPALHDTFGWFASAREAGLRLRMLDDVLVERRIHGGNVTLTDRATLHARYLGSAREAIRRRAANG